MIFVFLIGAIRTPPFTPGYRAEREKVKRRGVAALARPAYTRSMAIALTVFAPLVLLAALAGVLGMTGLFHRESSEYRKPDLSRLMSPLAAPVEIDRGRGRAVLFLHGYPATPFAFREPCAWADLEGYDAFAPLLPGCGTLPEDFTRVDLSQIYAFARDEYMRIRASRDEVHLVGSSMGGSLALRLAEEFSGTDRAPSSLVTVGSPVVLLSPFEGVWTYPHAPFARALGWFARSVNARIPESGREGEDGSERWLGYAGIFPRQTHSLILFLRSVRKGLPMIACPYLNMHCRTDRTVSFRNQAIIVRAAGTGNPARRSVKALAADMPGKRHTRHDLFLYDSTRRIAWDAALAHIRESAAGRTG